MKLIEEYLNVVTLDKFYEFSTLLTLYENIQDKSKGQQRIDKTMLQIITEMKQVEHTSQAILAMETICINLEKLAFARTEKDFEKCDNQRVENIEAFLAAKLIQSPKNYREKIKAAGITTIQNPPKNDTFLNIVDKRIKQLCVAYHSIDANETKKAFYKVRSDNLKLAKTLYIDLQKKALGIEKNEKKHGIER